MQTENVLEVQHDGDELVVICKLFPKEDNDNRICVTRYLGNNYRYNWCHRLPYVTEEERREADNYVEKTNKQLTNWRQIQRFPDYEMNVLQQVRNIKTHEPMKHYRNKLGLYFVFLCNNGPPKEVVLCKILEETFPDMWTKFCKETNTFIKGLMYD